MAEIGLAQTFQLERNPVHMEPNFVTEINIPSPAQA